MTDHQTMMVAGPAGPLAVDVTGDPTDGSVVFIHPINTAAAVWQPVIPLLDNPTVALDLRGHGRSVQTGPYAIEGGWLDDLIAVLDAFDLYEVHLVGGSLGGTIALAAAALHPDRVRSVTTFGSTLGVNAPPSAIDAMVDALNLKGSAGYFADLVPQIVGTAYRDNETILAAARNAIGDRDPAVVADILRGAFSADIRHLANKVETPVIAATGTEDPTCPPEMTREIAAVTAGRPVQLTGVGHLPMLEVPDQVAALIKQNMAEA